MFINYSVNTGLSVNTYRAPQGWANGDICGLVDDIVSGRDGSCPLEGTLAALEDGGLWQGSNATQEILEEIHELILNFLIK